MLPSMFNVRVPLDSVAGRDDVFLMNTFTDAQLIVSHEVVSLLDRLERDGDAAVELPEHRAALSTLAEHGFVVPDRGSERRKLEQYFRDLRESPAELRVTVLTTLQCNFACDYCFQGDHGDYNKFAAKMSLETAARVAEWTESRLDAIGSERLVLTFFGGEPLLNMPVVYYLAERLWQACQARGVRLLVNVITNGLLLTPAMIDRLNAVGLNGVKITLDGDRDTHNRMRPLRGGQGTFDRIIANVRQIAGRCRITIGGNFDETSVDSYPALLDFLEEQEFAGQLARVAFKPVIREPKPAPPKGIIPLTAVGLEGKPLNGTCMTSAGGGTSICDNCNFLDEKMSFLRDETKKRGFSTVDGVHMGPCEIHRRHAYTIGPEGSLYACPGFTGDATQATGHISAPSSPRHLESTARFDVLAPWRNCGDCAFIPVCGGGCSVAAHTEQQDMNLPNCHKASFEAGVVSLARDAAAAETRETAAV